MTMPADPSTVFLDNLFDSRSRLYELEQFLEYVENFFRREETYFREEAHPDLEHEFLPLFAGTFPPILHSSVILSTATLLELEMRGYCDALRKELSLDLRLSDLGGSALERFKNYVSKVAKLPFDQVGLRWEDTTGMFEVRNCLVHAGGNLEPFQRASVIRAFAARNGTPQLENNWMSVDSETSKVALELASNFIEKIYEVALAQFPVQHVAGGGGSPPPSG